MTKFSSRIMNSVVSPKGNRLNIRRLPTTTSRIMFSVAKGKAAGRTSGTFVDRTDGRWYKVTFLKKHGTPLRIHGWVRSDVIKLTTPVKDPNVDGEALIQKLIKNDKTLSRRFILIGTSLLELGKKGVNTNTFAKTFRNLVIRYNQRQNLLKTSKTLKLTQDLGISLIRLWFKIKGGGLFGIGAIPVAAVAVPVAEIVALLVAGTAAYFIFRPELDESLVDLKISSNLQKALDKVDPELQATIIAELEKQIDEAAQKGAGATDTDKLFKNIRNLAIGAGIFVIAREVIQLMQAKAKAA